MCGDPPKTILRLIDTDLRAHPERVRPLDPDLLERAERMVMGVDVSGEPPGKAEDAVPPPVLRMPRPLQYVADTHFGHHDIIDFCDRPFLSVDEMDRRMLRDLRAAEARGYVMHLGDLSLAPPMDLIKRYGLLFRSPDRQTLVAGNHDRVLSHRASYASLFGRVVGTEQSWRTNTIAVEDKLHGERVQVLASHAPQRDLRGCDLNLYGHHHNLLQRFPHVYRPDLDWLLESDRHYNVSVELIDYRPRTLDELHVLRHVEGRDLH